MNSKNKNSATIAYFILFLITSLGGIAIATCFSYLTPYIFKWCTYLFIMKGYELLAIIVRIGLSVVIFCLFFVAIFTSMYFIMRLAVYCSHCFYLKPLTIACIFCYIIIMGFPFVLNPTFLSIMKDYGTIINVSFIIACFPGLAIYVIRFLPASVYNVFAYKYCENCDKWYKKINEIYLKSSDREIIIRILLNDTPLSNYLTNAPVNDSYVTKYSRIEEYVCLQCKTKHTLDVSIHSYEKENEKEDSKMTWRQIDSFAVPINHDLIHKSELV